MWVASARASIRRSRSLRWRTVRALRELRDGRTVREFGAEAGRSIWAVAGRAWFLPAVTVSSVVVFQSLGLDRAPLAVFHDEQRSRELLGLLWQVEAAAIALVVAAALFAFESLTRQRSNLPLVEYANRSRLTQFLMHAASGLLGILVVLFSTSGRPVATAAFTAALIAGSALALLPAFLTRATRVVHPDWMQAARLEDVRRAVQAIVRMDAFERLGLIQLRGWAARVPIQITHRMGFDADRVTEQSPAQGLVADIDLDRLEALGRRQPDVFAVVTRLSDQVWDGASLIARTSSQGPAQDRRAVTMTPRPSLDGTETIVRDLHEEGLEAIRRESPTAAEHVMSMYAETWLAWPRAWRDYGQRMEGGLLEGVEPFRIGLSDQLRRHVWIQLEMAVDRGLPDHVDSIVGLLYTVTFGALELQALDLVKEMNLLARWLLSVRSGSYPDLAKTVIEDAWRFQVETCEAAGRDIDRGATTDMETIREAVRRVEVGYRSLIESLRILFDEGRYDAFKSLDNRFRKILQFWNPSASEPLARHLLEQPHLFEATEEQLQHARQVVEAQLMQRGLSDLRRGGRLAVLGWILHRSEVQPTSEEVADVARSVAGTLDSIEDVVRAVGVGLADFHDLVSQWVIMERPELEVGFVDADGPVLTAFAMVLLSHSNITRIPPAAWMSERRLSRLRELLSHVMERSEVWGRLGEDPKEVANRARQYADLLAQAERNQKEIERNELISKELDEAKVEEFRDAVMAGWREHRSLPELAHRGRTSIKSVPVEEWGNRRYGFEQLEPKGLFVSPTNWVGPGDSGREYGRRLAQAEVSAIVKQVIAKPLEVRGQGDVQDRLDQLLSALRTDEFEPTLVIRNYSG